MADDDCDKCSQPSVRELIERDLKHLKEQTALHFKVLEVAHEKSQEVLNDRLLRMYEFKDAMKDQAGTYVTRTELNLVIRAFVGVILTVITVAVTMWAMFH